MSKTSIIMALQVEKDTKLTEKMNFRE